MRSEHSLRRGETLRKETPTESIEQEDQKVHQRQKKSKTPRKDRGFWKNSEVSKVYHA